MAMAARRPSIHSAAALPKPPAKPNPMAQDNVAVGGCLTNPGRAEGVPPTNPARETWAQGTDRRNAAAPSKMHVRGEKASPIELLHFVQSTSEPALRRAVPAAHRVLDLRGQGGRTPSVPTAVVSLLFKPRCRSSNQVAPKLGLLPLWRSKEFLDAKGDAQAAGNPRCAPRDVGWMTLSDPVRPACVLPSPPLRSVLISANRCLPTKRAEPGRLGHVPDEVSLRELTQAGSFLKTTAPLPAEARRAQSVSGDLAARTMVDYVRFLSLAIGPPRHDVNPK